MKSLHILTYIYPGWHKDPVRRDRDGRVLNEWDLVINARPIFAGQRQPRTPLKIYDDADIESSEYQIDLALRYGIDAFVYCLYWSRGRRVLYRPIDEAFLKAESSNKIRFAVMWANRMPRGILPIKGGHGPLIHRGRFVYTDREDFINLVDFIARNYFSRANYMKINGRYLFSIFDSTFFLREVGTEKARSMIDAARRYLKKKGYSDILLMALNPAPAFYSEYKKAGFDAVSHYVWLPDWKGDAIQDYRGLIKRRSTEWRGYSESTELPYYPSISPGWDATPRGTLYPRSGRKRYPFYPVVIGENPEDFGEFMREALKFTMAENRENPLLFITSMNEWSEGHYIEPDTDFGYGFLEAIRHVRNKI